MLNATCDSDHIHVVYFCEAVKGIDDNGQVGNELTYLVDHAQESAQTSGGGIMQMVCIFSGSTPMPFLVIRCPMKVMACKPISNFAGFSLISYVQYLSSSAPSRLPRSFWLRLNTTMSSTMMVVPSIPQKCSSNFFWNISEVELQPNGSFNQ